MELYIITENGRVIETTPMMEEDALKRLREEWENHSNEEDENYFTLDEVMDEKFFQYINKYGAPVVHQIVNIDEDNIGNPYIARVAYYVVSRDEFDEISESLEEQTNEFSYRELCNGEGYYLEFEPQVIEKELPMISDPRKFGVDVVQVWGDN